MIYIYLRENNTICLGILFKKFTYSYLQWIGKNEYILENLKVIEVHYYLCL